MTPEDVLNRVIDTINERMDDYGHPNAMFEEIARRWETDKKNAAVAMADLKMARMKYAFQEDSAIDAIAYLVFAIMFSGDA